MNVTPEALSRIAPLVGNKAASYATILNRYLDLYGIDTPTRLACFMGQLLVESDDLTAFREGMSYRAERLLQVWPFRFPSIEIARQYERQPQKLANYVYGDRMGNRGQDTDDGWLHRGAGWIQLTGRDNQAAFAEAVDRPLEGIGDYLATPEGAAESACWFWWKHGGNRLADFGNIDAISDMVNLGRQTKKQGDAEGFAKRVAKTKLCKEVFQA